MLNQSQIDTFWKQGFLVVEDLLDAQTLANVKSEYADLMDDLYAGWQAEGLVPEAAEDMGFWDKLDLAFRGGFDWYQPFDICLPHSGIREETPMHFGPAVFDMVRSKRIVDVMEQLIGPELTSNPIQHVRIKPPESAVSTSETRAHVVATDWHQDLGVTLEEANDTKFITVWLAITDATVENGCLQVATTGPEGELLPHCADHQVSIPDQFLDKTRAVPAPVKAGGAVIFHPLTPHSSLSNTSEGYRWSFDLRYNVTGQPTGRSHFPEFVVRSQSDPSKELGDWRDWKAMWENTRSTLASQEHIAQHRWGNDANYCA